MSRKEEKKVEEKVEEKKPEVKQDSFLMTFSKRAFSAISMLSAFTLIVYGGHFYVTLLVLAVQCSMYFEIMALSHRRDQEEALPGFRFMSVLFLLVTLFVGYGKSLYLQLADLSITSKNEWIRTYLPWILEKHSFLSYSAYISCFCIFVLLLKNPHYKYQFKQFAWIHMALFAVVVSLQFVSYNTHQGLIWFVIPITLINVNDIFAYLSGIAFGKHPLIEISPKKTVEGFVGAAIWTVIFGFLLAGSLRHYDFMVCPKVSYTVSELKCVHDPIFELQEYAIPLIFTNILSSFGYQIQTVMIAPIQFHIMVFAIFASIIAPFGGFFASGLKRALKIKDFGDLIPGHGGIADRMDCQTMMSIFTFIYYQAFIVAPTVTYSLVEYLNKLSTQEQKQLFEVLKQKFQ